MFAPGRSKSSNNSSFKSLKWMSWRRTNSFLIQSIWMISAIIIRVDMRICGSGGDYGLGRWVFYWFWMITDCGSGKTKTVDKWGRSSRWCGFQVTLFFRILPNFTGCNRTWHLQCYFKHLGHCINIELVCFIISVKKPFYLVYDACPWWTYPNQEISTKSTLHRKQSNNQV